MAEGPQDEDWTDQRTGPEEESPPIDQPYDPSQTREWLRGALAGGLLVLLAFMIVGSFVSLWFNWASSAEVEKILTHALAPIVGLVGAATGFYYGGRAG